VAEVFKISRGSLGSRGIRDKLNENGNQVSRYLVARLMKEQRLVSKQPGAHKYKPATAEHLSIPNRLNRRFTGVATSLLYEPVDAGFIWPLYWICTPAKWWAGRSLIKRRQSWSLRLWMMRIGEGENHPV
jgi:putative transposase